MGEEEWYRRAERHAKREVAEVVEEPREKERGVELRPRRRTGAFLEPGRSGDCLSAEGDVLSM